jgi:hypothetical protein
VVAHLLYTLDIYFRVVVSCKHWSGSRVEVTLDVIY